MQERHFYEFGPFRLDAAQGLLLRDGKPVPLTPKAYETLLALVESEGRLLSKEELLKRVWPDTFVEEGNLTHNVWTLRKTLGEEEEGAKYIETIPRRGYRFVASVTEGFGAEEGAASSPAPAVAPAASTAPPRKPAVASVVLGLALAVLAGVVFRQRPMLPKAAPPVSPAVRSLAVLPFKPIGAGVAGGPVELGMADALITKLSNIRQIDVRPTRAIAGYTDPTKDLVSTGRELKVDAVLDGTVQRDGDRVRVTVQLIRVADGKPLWADRFDESWTGIFALQDRVSEQVATALLLRLSLEEAELLRRRYTENAEAYQLYLRGRFQWNKRTAESITRGIESFQEAIAKDPNYALAYSGLAESYVLLPWYGGITPKEAFEKARAAATRALEIDPRLAEAHTALAYVAERYDWDWAGAEREYRRALELHPKYPTAHQWYGEYLVQVGRLDEAAIEMKQALELAPLSLIINTELANVYLHAREFDRAAAQARRALEIDPSFGPAQVALGRCYMHRGMYREADVIFRRVLAADPEDAWVLSHVAYNDAVSGKEDSARRILRRLSRRKGVPAELFATVHAGLGEKALALDWLERSCRSRETGMAWIKVHPGLDGLRDDPRFPALVRCVGLTPDPG